MCRWLAYDGPPILIERLLSESEHSLIQQSLSSRMGRRVTNGDGLAERIGDDHGVLVLSEPLDEDTADWTEVPDAHMLIAENGEVTLTPLAL